MSLSTNPVAVALLRKKVDEAIQLMDAHPELVNAPVSEQNAAKPLDIALQAGLLTAAQAVVARGGVSVSPPLQNAAMSLSVPVMQWVYDSGLDTAVTEPVGMAALCSRWMEPDIPERKAAIEFLLSRGLDPAAIALVAVQRNAAIVAVLVSTGRFNAACFAALGNMMELQDLPHPFTQAVLPDGSNALFVAVAKHDIKGVAAALASGVAPNAYLPIKGEWVGTALHLACATGFVEGAQALVTGGADPNARKPSGESIVGCAAVHGGVNIIRFATAAASRDAVAAVNVTARGRRLTPLLACVTAYGRAAAVQALVDGGANPNDTLDKAPAIAYPAYLLQAPHDCEARGYSVDEAKAVVQALVKGGAAGLDTYLTVLRMTPRQFLQQAGLL